MPQKQVSNSGGTRQFIDKVALLGEERYWLTTKFVFCNEEQQYFVGSFSIDITDQIKAEQAAVENEKLAAATQMVAMVAHEVNNPLTAVTSSLFLLGHEPLPPQARELVEIAQSELSRLNHIARLVINFYKQTEHPVALDPCALLNDVIDTVSERFSVRNARIVRDFLWQGTFTTSGQQLREALENILTNAFESGASEMRVRVCAGHGWRNFVRSGLRISILDNGRGMDLKQRKHVFEPFFSTKRQKGVGLGLWTSKAIVLRSGGHISLRSTNAPGRRGTCVSIFLPNPTEPSGMVALPVARELQLQL